MTKLASSCAPRSAESIPTPEKSSATTETPRRCRTWARCRRVKANSGRAHEFDPGARPPNERRIAMDSYTAVFRTDDGPEWTDAEAVTSRTDQMPWEAREHAASALLHFVAGAVQAGATLVRIDLPTREAVA